MSNRISDIIKKSRTEIIEGTFVNLVPFTLVDTDNVIRLRNQNKNRHFLNQSYLITADGQAKWYEDYLLRTNDIYWSVYNKQKKFIGTVRVYDIDEDNDICDQGSLIIDEEVSAEAPYAIEVEILTLDYIFSVLKIGNVINEDRADNKVMNSLTKKLGFKYIKDTVKDGNKYKYYLLNPEDYEKNREKFSQIIDYWMKR